MRRVDVVIVNGGLGGVITAITARRHYEDAHIALIRREREVVVPCGIPYIFGTLGSVEKNLFSDALLVGNEIELIMDEVTSIDRSSKVISMLQGDTVAYEKLVLATGADAAIPPIPGVELENVFPVRKDADYLRKLQGLWIWLRSW